MSTASTDISTFDVDSVERNRSEGYPDLSDQDKAFAITYITNGYDHRAAADKVGRAKSAGVQMKREPLIAAFIVDLQAKYLAESVVTRTSLDIYLDKMEEIALGQVEIPIITGAGDEIHAKKFHADLAMKVYTERSKLHGIVKDDDKSVAVNVTINAAGLLGGEVIIDEQIIEHENE